MATSIGSKISSLKIHQSEVLFTLSNKGEPQLIYENAIFNFNKENNETKYWSCVERECGVYLHTSLIDEFTRINGTHTHPVNPDQIEVKLLRDKMKARILGETTSITRIYDEEMAKAKLSKGATAIMPTIVEFRSNMSKARRKKTPVIPLWEVFNIPKFYQETLLSERFLLIDVFLKRGLPVAFCLLPNKRGTTYTDLFERLKDEAILMGKQFNPKLIITDYEPGLLPIVGQEFPAAIHSGCMFHFNQSIHRKITDLGLARDYLNNDTIRDQCLQLMALSLMPIDEVEDQFKRLQTIMTISLDNLVLYFKNQWVHGVVPIHMWNFHEVTHRTNNICEAYNLRFATRLSKKHPNIWSFIKLIQDEHVRFERILLQLAAGASAPPQSIKTKAFQARFDTLCNRFSKKEINANELLTGFSLLIGKKKK
ncbi:unnamed protein product [Adineta steineri]|uniref:MULE transposase domain-containing protein n=1 Tax=Adineta steineri TaxID=433720 RepID=A0A815FKF8_9BILA|nr:unnamed protein product [Adineta steineri]CAF1326648.1 unnamed protein product [Adineta steineri]